VHVPQARHQEAAGRVDDLGLGRRRAGVVGLDAQDEPATHQHPHVLARDAVPRIEEPGMPDQQIAARHVGQPPGQVRRPAAIGLALRRLQAIEQPQVGRGEHLEPVVDHGGGLQLLIQPHRHRREVDARDQMKRQASSAGGDRRPLRQRSLARRQQGQPLTRRLQQRARQHAVEFRRRVGRQVEGPGLGPGHAPLLDTVLPSRLAVDAIEALGQRSLPVVVALGLVAQRQAARVERPAGPQVIATTALAEGMVDEGLIALAARRLAPDDHPMDPDLRQPGLRARQHFRRRQGGRGGCRLGDGRCPLAPRLVMRLRCRGPQQARPGGA